MPSLQHNFTQLLNIFLTLTYPKYRIQNQNTLHFRAPLGTVPYSACLDPHHGPPFARFRACSLVRFRTCPASVGPFARVRAHFLLRL